MTKLNLNEQISNPLFKIGQIHTKWNLLTLYTSETQGQDIMDDRLYYRLDCHQLNSWSWYNNMILDLENIWRFIWSLYYFYSDFRIFIRTKFYLTFIYTIRALKIQKEAQLKCSCLAPLENRTENSATVSDSHQILVMGLKWLLRVELRVYLRIDVLIPVRKLKVTHSGKFLDACKR